MSKLGTEINSCPNQMRFIERKKMKTALVVLVLAILSLLSPRKEVTVKPYNRCAYIETDNGHGTGVIVAKDLVLTNFHMLETRSDIMVNGKIAKILKVDPKNDPCLLNVDTAQISPVDLAEKITQDEEIVVIGNPMDHHGLIARGRVVDLADGQVFIDARIFFGSSGSGVYNSKGQMVGIVSAMQGSVGAGFPYGVVVPSFVIMKFLAS